MIALEFLNQIRKFELENALPFFNSGAKVLEVGSGTGFQAKMLKEKGFEVEAIDLPSSNYFSSRIFPVSDYDGLKFPFPDNSFDIVFSSNTVEHVSDTVLFFKECERVLKPNGINIHILPTATWRFWTSLTNYIELVQRLCIALLRIKNISLGLRKIAEALYFYGIPSRHGERGNFITELWTFSHFYWDNKMKQYVSTPIVSKPMKLFYSGHLIFKDSLTIKNRQVLSRFLGSSTRIYVMHMKSKNHGH